MAAEFRGPRALRPRSKVDRWYTHVVLVTTVCVIGFPLIYAVVVSTQSNTEFFSRRLAPGSSLGDNFDVVCRQRDRGSYMVNSIVQAVIITIGKTVTAMLAGLAFVHFDFRAKFFVFWFVLVTLMMPTEISIIALFQIVGDLGWSNSMLGLTVPRVGDRCVPVPPALRDAARRAVRRCSNRRGRTGAVPVPDPPSGCR